MNHTAISAPGTHWGDRVICITENGRCCTVAHVYGRTVEEVFDRAAFFVRAANSHTELVKALDSMVGRFGGSAVCQLDMNAINEARAILAKAEGKP